VSKKGNRFAGIVTGHTRELKRRFSTRFLLRRHRGKVYCIGLFGSALDEMELTTGSKDMSPRSSSMTILLVLPIEHE
jgi:hypothetical protein